MNIYLVLDVVRIPDDQVAGEHGVVGTNPGGLHVNLEHSPHKS